MTFEQEWRLLQAKRPELKQDSIRIAVKLFKDDLEQAWHWGRGEYKGFVAYLLRLQDKTPALATAEFMTITQANYKKALQRCYAEGLSQLPKAEHQEPFDFAQLFGGIFRRPSGEH